MANTVIMGMQWGDEGKGKIVDLLCPAFDAVVRYQGGDNAGHTVKFGDQHFALHLIPSGILHPEMTCVLGNGMVINPERFFEELAGLEAAGVETAGRLFISRRAHVLLPAFCRLDAAREASRGKAQIGTTARGIGPAYEAKASRFGLRMGDLEASNFEARLFALLDRVNTELRSLGAEEVDKPEALERCGEWRERLVPRLRETAYLLDSWIEEGRAILFEGAQGVLLDIDHGTYPYVTSSSPTPAGASAGSGVAPSRIDGVAGVLKAYTTRVGGGPFVTELGGQEGEFLRDRGNEIGTTTGRPRRCGWLDAVVARYSRMIAGVDVIAFTKLDVLDTFDEVSLCTGYRIDGEVRREVPSSLDELARAEPVYRTVKGWKKNTVGILDYDDLPQAAKDYVSVVEEEVGCPVGLVSTGPRREETILRPETPLTRLTSGKLEAVVEARGVG